MKFKPILFSTPMVWAIIEERKSQTRRTVKPQPKVYKSNGDEWYSWSVKRCYAQGPLNEFGNDPLRSVLDVCPYGHMGDVLWVRETFTIIDWWEDSKAVQIMFEDAKTKTCLLTDDEWKKFDKWVDKSARKPSLFLFKSCCRIFLQITDVKVERLQDISDEDAGKEGVLRKDLFGELWASINGDESWNANPFVWCVSFKKIDKPENF